MGEFDARRKSEHSGTGYDLMGKKMIRTRVEGVASLFVGKYNLCECLLFLLERSHCWEYVSFAERE